MTKKNRTAPLGGLRRNVSSLERRIDRQEQATDNLERAVEQLQSLFAKFRQEQDADATFAERR